MSEKVAKPDAAPPSRDAELESYARRLAQRERQQAAIARLGRYAIGAEDLSSLLELAVALLAETLECELAKVLELLPDGKRLLLRAGVGWNEGLVGEATVGTGPESQAGYTLAVRSPVVVSDLQDERRFRGPPLLFDHGVRSGMSTVIGRPDAPWGVLGVHARRQLRFGEDDVNFLQSTAHLLSEAIAKRQSEAALHESRMELARQYTELETIYRQLPVGLAVVDRQLRFVRVNQILAEIDGVPIEDSIGRRLSELIPIELAAKVEACMRAVFDSGRPSGEVELEGATAADVRGTRHWIASYHPVASAGQEVDRVICVVREVTREKQAGARREAEHAVSQLLGRVEGADAIPAILEAFATPLRFAVAEFWDLDESGRSLRHVASILPGAPAWEARWRRASEAIRLTPGRGLVGRVWQERRPIWLDEPSEPTPRRAELVQELALANAGAVPVLAGDQVLGVLTFFSRDPIAARDEVIATMTHVGRDVGECWRHLRAERAVRASEQLFRDIVEDAPIPMFLHAFDGAILSVNRAFTSATGYAAADVPTKRDWMRLLLHVPEEAVNARIADLHDRLRDPLTILEPEEVTVWTRFGRERRWVLYRCPPMQLADGREFATTMAVDVTERDAAERALADARDAAEAASRLKSAFLANVSHEIRTPMTAILGYVDLLGDDVLDPAQQRLIATIKRNGLYLIDVIDDILDLSRIEADRLEIERTRFSPLRLVTEVASLMRVRAQEKALELCVEYGGPVPASIESDAMRLRQILINLVGNAVKFTRHGEIRIVTRLLPGDEPQLQIDVIDTGMGIAEDLLERLFEPFVQGATSRGHRSDGAGLGLTISRRLADALGGTLTAKSQEGKGSCFRLTVPTGSLEGVTLEEAHDAIGDLVEDEPVAVPRLAVRVLVVDDHADVRELAVRLLERCGARADAAGDGEQALVAVEKAHGDGDPYGVVLLDMQLPVRDGYQTAHLLREEGFVGAIVALTASAMTGDRERCLDAGCSDYLTKPIVTREFMATMARYGSPSSPVEPSQGRKRVARVLLVEDDADARVALALLLERRGGHEVRAVGTGKEAIELARSWAADVALVDLTLPDMDGFEVLASLRALDDTRARLHIALTGRTESEVMERWQEAGFDHLVVKPVRDVGDVLKLFPST